MNDIYVYSIRTYGGKKINTIIAKLCMKFVMNQRTTDMPNSCLVKKQHHKTFLQVGGIRVAKVLEIIN